MSIINDALKKASQEKVAGPEVAEERIVEPRKYAGKPAVEPKVAKKGANKRLIISSGIIGLVGFGLFLSFLLIREQRLKAKLEQVIPSRAISEQTAALPRQVTKGVVTRKTIATAQKAPSLHLTGIVRGHGEPYAFINGKIVEEGDTVGGAKVIEIRQKEVRLDFEGEDLLLTLK